MKQSEWEARQREAQRAATMGGGNRGSLVSIYALPAVLIVVGALTDWWLCYALTPISAFVGVWLFSRWTRRPLLKGK